MKITIQIEKILTKKIFNPACWFLLFLITGCSQPYEFNGTLYNPPISAPDIPGVNWDGESFRMDNLEGTVAVLFFGYINCPDICPMTLSEMKIVATELGQEANEVSFVFITVDPERDTLERLAEYIPGFSDKFYGIYVPEKLLEEVKKGYGVYSELNPKNPYFVDHTGGVYIVDRQGELRLLYGQNPLAEMMTPDIQYLLSQ